MELTEEQLSRLKAAMLDQGSLQGVASFGPPQETAVIGDQYRWPNGEVKYQLDSQLSQEEKALVRNTLQNLQVKLQSCIRFVETSSGNRIHVVNNGGGCYSALGYRNQNTQPLSLQSNGCMYAGVIEHEFIHALGIYHQQSRSDRDDHVEILWQNIPDNRKGQFQRYDTTVINSYGLPYDFSSLMHYGSTDWGIGGQMTIRTLDASKQNLIGNVLAGTSSGDIELIRRHYHCEGE